MKIIFDFRVIVFDKIYMDMKNNVVAIVVTHFPNLELLSKNILLLLSQVDEVVIVDNTEYPGYISQYVQNLHKVTLFLNENKGGIAGGLNVGIKYAWKHDFEFALFLDQDSTPTSNLIDTLIQGFSENKEKVVMVCPTILDVNKNNKNLPENVNKNDFEKIFVCITSGTLINLNKSKQIGIFNEKLFIDYVDFEYCLRAKNLEFTILKSCQAILYHSLGKIEKYNFWGIKLYTTNHNYMRRYYKSRNCMYLIKKEGVRNINFISKVIFRQVTDFCKIICFESEKFKKIKFMFLGLVDGWREKMGQYKKQSC